MNQITGRDVAAIVLALGVTVSVIIMCALVYKIPLLITTSGTQFLASLIGVMIGAIATYIGRRAP